MSSSSLAAVFDRLYSAQHRKKLERWIVVISVVGFLTHLAHIFLACNLPHPAALIAAAGKNYLSAIYTPFSFILFYEVLILIASLPQSTTQSIATQFEIVSLIFIRGFFKDIAGFDLETLRPPARELMPAFLEVSAGLFMFLLVTVFQHAASRKAPELPGEPASALKQFIQRKKIVALALTVLFVSMAAISLW